MKEKLESSALGKILGPGKIRQGGSAKALSLAYVTKEQNFVPDALGIKFSTLLYLLQFSTITR